MSTFDIRPDAPGTLRAEALHITIRFDRTSETTGRVSWNVPIPAAGCMATEQAYCGMLVTLDTNPVSNTTVPTNGSVYSSDPTANTNLHAGDKIGSAMVVGAFYQDTVTTHFDVSGLQPNTAYYVSGFPCDCQYRYFQEGVHAYSVDFKQPGTADTSGTQVVILNEGTDPSGVLLTDPTGLSPSTDYSFKVHLGITPTPNRPLDDQECVLVPPTYTVTVNGSSAQTYSELVTEINRQFSLIESPNQGAAPPYAGTYVILQNPTKLYQWNGYIHEEKVVIVQTGDPSVVAIDTYWFDPSTSTLSVWNGAGWSQVQYIDLSTDPTLPICDQTVWVNGSSAFRWNGTTWCTELLYEQSTDPSVVSVPCGSYWYNSATGFLYSWNDNEFKWVSVDAIQSTTDPLLLPVGSYWFDETNSVLKQFSGSAWAVVPGVTYSSTTPTTVVPGTLWFNTQEFELFVRNGTTSTWDPVSEAVVSYPTNPMTPSSCELWWQQAESAVTLHMWNTTSAQWVTVVKFYDQTNDPSLPPVLPQGTIWIDDSGQVYQWENNCFVPISAIETSFDPTNPPDGTVWYDSDSGIFYIRSSGVWVALSVTNTTSNPASLPAGTYWYDPTSPGHLSQWNGTTWVTLLFNSTLVAVPTGTLWYNTLTGVTYEWNGSTWIPHDSIAKVEYTCYNNLKFTHTLAGSLSFMLVEDVDLFNSLTATFRLDSPVPGQDGVSDTPSYAEPGIGTDLSTDERNKLMNEIRYSLGYPVLDVEVTPEQLDLAITIAISELRARTSVAYKRGYFFMRTNAEQQRYLLTNKVQGMHKIVSVLGVTRLTSAFLSSAHGAGVYGQIILTHLYNMGNFDILSYHLMAEYVKTLEIMFAGRITFNWDEHKRELFLHDRMPFAERVVMIEAMVERSEQDILSDRWCKEWIRRFSTAKVKEMLAAIRGKFSTLPGAGGSVTLNAADLKMQAEAEIAACLQEIDDFVVDRPEEIGYTSAFVFG